MQVELREQIDRNFDWFQRNLSKYIDRHPGEFALLRDRAVIAFYETIADADKAGQKEFPDGIYSIQEVVTDPIDLGFFSHAGH